MPRKHHTFPDRPGDPHSPKLIGFWRVQCLNVYYYAREARRSPTLPTFAPDLPADAMDRALFSHGLLGLGVGLGRGTKNFGNTAYNSRLLSWVTGGESLHNNHHAHPRAPKFSVRRWEFDPSWPLIRIGARLRLLQMVGERVTLQSP